jgi:hypothetical protein
MAASQVLKSGFTAEERRRGEPFQLAMALVRGLTAAEQAGPATRMLLEAGLSQGETQAAAAGLAEALATLRAADVSFSAAVWRDNLLSHVAALASLLESSGAPVQPLAQSLRWFLVTHLTASRCAPHAGDPRAVMSLRASFNLRFGRAAPPITIEETLPARIDRPIQKDPEPEMAAIALQLRRLRLTDRNNPEWKNLLRQARDAIESWEVGSPAGPDQFHWKAGLLQALLEVMPADESRHPVLRIYTAMISTSPVRRSHPAGWFWHAQVLQSRLRLSGAQALLEELQASGDGLLSYYAALERIAPQPAPACSPGGVCPAMGGPDAMRAELLSFLLN